MSREYIIDIKNIPIRLLVSCSITVEADDENIAKEIVFEKIKFFQKYGEIDGFMDENPTSDTLNGSGLGLTFIHPDDKTFNHRLEINDDLIEDIEGSFINE